MAGMKCLYGMELSNHEAPNDVELVVYTDKEWERLWIIKSEKIHKDI